MNFTIAVFWRSVGDAGEAVNVQGNTYVITGLTPGISYNITLVTFRDGARTDSISISITTLSNGEYMYVVSHRNCKGG